MKGGRLRSQVYYFFFVVSLSLVFLEQSQAFVAPSNKATTSPLHHACISNVKKKPPTTVLHLGKKVSTTLAGRMWPFLQKFRITPGKLGKSNQF